MPEGAGINNVFLYGELYLPIIMQQPTDSAQQPAKPGFRELVKSLYVTKQASEIWVSYCEKTLKKWGFRSSILDNFVYFCLEWR